MVETKTTKKSKEKNIDKSSLKSEKIKEEVVETSELKKEKKKSKEKDELDSKTTLVPLTDYIKCGVHLGTKVITPDMRKYVYKRRADGLAVLNTNLIDEKLRESINFLMKYDPKDTFIVCKREAGWKPVIKFSEVTGIRCFTKKYPSGVITNTQLKDFFEPKLALICDPWVDKNAYRDSLKIKIPIFSISDTNNYTNKINQIVPANNKSTKSIGLILYVLAKSYLEQQNKKPDFVLEDFTGKLEDLEEK